MRNLPSRRLILPLAAVAMVLVAQISASEAGSRNRCDLTLKGKGLHSCQCETLTNHRADWKTLMHLSGMNVCNSPTIGGGTDGSIPVSYSLPPVKPPPGDDEHCNHDGENEDPEDHESEGDGNPETEGD
jgi:hypothetical protein